MFSNRVCVSHTTSLDLSELQAAGSITTNIIAHGLTWSFLFLWTSNDRIKYKVGLDQPPDCMVGAAVRASVVVESSSARLRRSYPKCMLTCSDAPNSTWLYPVVHPAIMELLVENGALKIRTTLEVFEPIKVRSISPAALYQTDAPASCMAILGVDNDNSVYVLCRSSVLSPEIEQWCVYCFRRFLPQRGITLALINMRPNAFRGSGFDRENKRLAVTQIYDENSSLQLDIVDWVSGQHTTRNYQLENQQLHWSAATPHRQGWLCVACGIEIDDQEPSTVRHQFWLLGDDGHLKLLTEFVHEFVHEYLLPAASVNGHFYCLTGADGCRMFLWVCSWDQPNNWQPYELTPCPDFDERTICYEWGQLLLVGELGFLSPVAADHQVAMFKLRFDLTDCLVEPYVVLPKEVGTDNWTAEDDGAIVFVEEEKIIRFIGINKPPTLKTSALMAEQVAHKDWKQKLTTLLGQSTNSFLS